MTTLTIYLTARCCLKSCWSPLELTIWESERNNQPESVATKVKRKEPNLPSFCPLLSELHEVELNLFPVVASMTGPAESKADGIVPESVNGTFKSIILIKEPVPLGEVLVSGQDDASCLFETDAVH